MAEVHEETEAQRQTLGRKRRGKFVSVRDCSARPREFGSRTALALSHGFRLAADRLGVRGESLCYAGMATADPDFLADRPGRLARHAELPELPYRGRTGNI